DELTAMAGAFTLSFNCSVMHPHQILNECEADTQSSFRACKRPVALFKKLENAREQFRRDTAAIVDDPQHRKVPVALNASSNLPAGGSEFDGIVQQVCDDLFDASEVGANQHGTGRQLRHEAEVLLFQDAARCLETSLNKGREVCRFLTKLNLSVSHAGDVQQVVE